MSTRPNFHYVDYENVDENAVYAALPLERTIINRLFAVSSVDFAGPFGQKSFTGRACKITKGNFCVFVCFSTKAIHLEPTSDLSMAKFLAAFNIFSDNGANFFGTSKDIERNFRCILRKSKKVIICSKNNC